MQRSVSHRKPEGCGAKRCFLPFLCIAKRVAGHGVDSNQKDSGGNLKFIGTYRGFFEVSTVMHFEERKRFPQELFLPGFPTRDQTQAGTEDSSPPSHHPEPRPSRRRSHSSTKFLFTDESLICYTKKQQTQSGRGRPQFVAHNYRKESGICRRE